MSSRSSSARPKRNLGWAIYLCLIISILIFLRFCLGEMQELDERNRANAGMTDITDTIPDDYPVYEWQMGTWLKRPIGFTNAWRGYLYKPPATRAEYEENLKNNSERSGYDVSTGKYNSALQTEHNPYSRYNYCLPSKKYFKRHYYIYGRGRSPGVGPCVTTTDPSSQLDYPVGFMIRWAFMEGAENSAFARIFHRNEKAFKEKGHYISQDLASAEHNKSGPITGNTNYYIYHTDNNLSVQFTCRKSSHVCEGSVWVKTDDLIFNIELPFDRVQIGDERLWEVPVYETIDVIKSWRQ